MERYDCSETVIRFVMVQLKAEGPVYGVPGKGVYLAEEPAA